MLRHLLVIAFILTCAAFPAWAVSFDVTNVQVSIQSTDAVKARDEAMTAAQRKAFATLVGRSEDQIKEVTDSQIARLVSGFSVQGERLAARSYSARFTIRFNPNATTGFISANGFDLVEQAPNQPLVAQNTDTPSAAASAGMTSEPTQAVPKVAEAVIILPVLDIGSRRVLWDEPNPWRQIWQARDYSQPGLPVRVPLGDVSDIADIPDTSFLSGGVANITSMLDRYVAGNMYVIVAKNQGAALDPSGGMALTLYRHDGRKLKFIRKTTVHSRPGYMFDDAVKPAMQMVVMAQNNATADSDEGDRPQQDPVPEDVSANAPAKGLQPLEEPTPAPVVPQLPLSANKPILVTIPYQSLPQWVGIQRRLRLVAGIQSVMPLRVSPSSAQVRITTSVSNAQELSRNLALQGFEMQMLPHGEIALTEK